MTARKIVNSSGVVFRKGVNKTVVMRKDENSPLIKNADDAESDADRKMAAARHVMKKRFEALRVLAK
jgi:hypothetical protein